MNTEKNTITTAVRAGMLIVTAVWILALYHFLGNTTDVEHFGRSVFKWMTARWADANFAAGGYSLGWLMPFVSIYDLWRKRKDLAVAEKETCYKALWLITIALFLHWAAARAQQPRLSLFSFLLLTWSSVLYLYGRNLARLILFPIAYLTFCIPFNFLDSLTFPLRMISTVISTALLNGIGIEVERTGSAIIATSGKFQLDVADPCSGIKSMLTMAALAMAYGYFFTVSNTKRFIIFISSIPIAMASNIIRIISLGILAQLTSQETAMGFYHVFSGYLVFITGLLLLILVGELLERACTTHQRKDNNPSP